jgi:plasmid stabilization system protein ParE
LKVLKRDRRIADYTLAGGVELAELVASKWVSEVAAAAEEPSRKEEVRLDLLAEAVERSAIGARAAVAQLAAAGEERGGAPWIGRNSTAIEGHRAEATAGFRAAGLTPGAI